MEKTIVMRARAFSHEGIRLQKVLVCDDGTVRVWDASAGHYTTCHILCVSAQRRALRIARGEIR